MMKLFIILTLQLNTFYYLHSLTIVLIKQGYMGKQAYDIRVSQGAIEAPWFPR